MSAQCVNFLCRKMLINSLLVDMEVSELAPYSPNRVVNVQLSIPYLINVYHILSD